MIVLDLKKLPPPFLKNVLKLLHKNSFPFYSVVFQYYIIKCSNVLFCFKNVLCFLKMLNEKKCAETSPSVSGS